MRKWRVHILIAVMIAGTCAVAAARPKIDVIVLKNRDRVTCEIKSLSRGKLEVKTDSMDKVYIEWADIAALASPAYFHVTASDGSFYFGSLEIADSTNNLRVESDTTIVTLPALTVVEIAPIERSFLSRNKGSVEVGFNYAKSTDVAEFYFDFSDRYRSRRNIVDVGINTTLTSQSDPEETKRKGAIGAAYYRILPRSITVSVGAKAERNDELDVKRRILGRFSAGYDQIATNQNTLLLAAGLAVNSETSYSTDETTTSLEGVLYANYSAFQYNTPKISLDAITSVYPSITEQGRVRFELTLEVRKEIIADLFFELEFYYDYDNKPASGGETSRDYGIRTSLGYTW
jgi:Holliday junction resolvase